MVSNKTLMYIYKNKMTGQYYKSFNIETDNIEHAMTFSEYYIIAFGKRSAMENNKRYHRISLTQELRKYKLQKLNKKL